MYHFGFGSEERTSQHQPAQTNQLQIETKNRIPKGSYQHHRAPIVAEAGPPTPFLGLGETPAAPDCPYHAQGSYRNNAIVAPGKNPKGSMYFHSRYLGLKVPI